MVPALAFSYRKTARQPPSLMSPFNRRIDINSSYSFASYALRKDLGFNPAIFVTEIVIGSEIVLHDPSSVSYVNVKTYI